MNSIRVYPGGRSLNVVEQYPELLKKRSLEVKNLWKACCFLDQKQYTVDEALKISTDRTVPEHLTRQMTDSEYRQFVLNRQ